MCLMLLLPEARALTPGRRCYLISTAEAKRLSFARRAYANSLHHSDVEEFVRLLMHHPMDPMLHNDGKLVGIGRIIGPAVGYGRSNQVTGAVLVLQPA